MTWLTAMEYLFKWPRICSTCRNRFSVLSLFTTYYRVCKYINTTGATSGAGTTYPSGAPEFISRFWVGFVLLDLQFYMFSRACGSYQDFLDRGLLLTRKLLNQGFLLFRLKSSLRKFYGRHHDLVDCYRIYVSQMTTNMFHLSQSIPGPFLVHYLSLGL